MSLRAWMRSRTAALDHPSTLRCRLVRAWCRIRSPCPPIPFLPVAVPFPLSFLLLCQAGRLLPVVVAIKKQATRFPGPEGSSQPGHW